jgi:ribosomal protein L44E
VPRFFLAGHRARLGVLRRKRRVQRADDGIHSLSASRSSSCPPASPTNTAVVECTIPPDMRIERWRRLRRSTAPTQRDPWSRLLAAARRVARHGERRCDHLHDTVSRYDYAAKRLELLLTCPVCETEKVLHSLAYEPRFEPSVASVHPMHAREGAAVDALDRAA